MVEVFGSVLQFVFGSNSWLATTLISMLPIIELKGAIPIGVSSDFWGEHALTSSQALVCGLVGSSLVVPILALVFMPILKWMKSTKIFIKISTKIEQKIAKSSSKINKEIETKQFRKKTILKMIGIFIFVADPFPFTGVWTGTCVGIAIGLTFWQTVISVVLGNIVAGTLVTTVCSIFPNFSTMLFFVMIGIILLICLIALIKYLIRKKLKQEQLVIDNDILLEEKSVQKLNNKLVSDEQIK